LSQACVNDLFAVLRQIGRRAADHYSELFGHGCGSRKAEIGGSIQRNGFRAIEKISAGSFGNPFCVVIKGLRLIKTSDPA
jgi:hypothetical protein